MKKKSNLEMYNSLIAVTYLLKELKDQKHLNENINYILRRTYVDLFKLKYVFEGLAGEDVTRKLLGGSDNEEQCL